MLRITEAPAAHATTLKLEGGLAGPWVRELRLVAEGWLLREVALRLDVSGVTFADAAGASLLRELRGRSVEIRGASLFVAELLGGEAP